MSRTGYLFNSVPLPLQTRKWGILTLSVLSIFLSACSSIRGQSTEQDHLNNKAEFFKNNLEYDSAEFYYRKINNLAGLSGNQKVELLSMIELADVLILQRKYAKAKFELSNAYLKIQNKFKEELGLYARYLEVEGGFMLSTGKLDSAKIYLDRAINLRSVIPEVEDTSLHYAFNKMGNYYLALSDYDSAYLLHKAALDLSLKKVNQVNYSTASSYQNLGIAAHMKGDYNQAQQFYTQSLLLKEQLFKKNNPALSTIYWTIGKFFTDSYKYELALEYYDKSEQVLNSRYDRDDLQFAHLYWNKGNVYTLQGDYNRASNFLLKAYSIFEDNYGADNQFAYNVLLDLGFVYQKKGDNEQAIAYYLQAAKNQKDAKIIKIYRNLGNIFNSQDDTISADKYYHLSIEYARNYFPGAKYDLALCYQYYGEFLSKQGESASPLKYYESASEIFGQMFGDKSKDLAKVYLLESQYYFSEKEYNAALKKSQEALITLLPAFNEDNPQINPGLDDIVIDLYLPNILSFKSKSLFYRYKLSGDLRDLTLSLETIYLALDVIEEIRKTYFDEESQLILNKEARNLINLGVRVTHELFTGTGDRKYLAEAFQFSEKGQSIILLSALRGLKAQKSVNIPENTLKFEDNLLQELAAYNNFLYQEKQKKDPDESKIELWSDKIFNLNLSHDSLLGKYKILYPEYFRLKYDYSVISADSLQKWLPDDQAILEYHMTDSSLFGFLVTHEAIDFILCGAKADLKAELDSLRQHFDRKEYFNAGKIQFESLTRASAKLYDLLIQPFNSKITGKRLVIIPDGELGYLSFDLLLSEDVSDGPDSYARLPWLIREHAVSYSSSATVYYEQSRSRPGRKATSLLAFAPSYDYYLSKRDASAMDSAVLNLSPLTGTREEIDAISELLKTTKRFDTEATEDYFKSRAGKYGILHLAMHTIIDNQNPLYSKLVFTPGPDGSAEDGFLNTYELFRLHLPGQLAVLSACNTGGGKLESGEGIISLARGFFYAGIPSVVMTLWEIEDHSSASLMQLFYANLKTGLPNDIALQQAKLDYLDQAGKLQSHPYFWAGYVNIGKTHSIDFKTSIVPLSIVLIAIAAILASVFLYLVINRRVFFSKKRH